MSSTVIGSIKFSLKSKIFDARNNGGKTDKMKFYSSIKRNARAMLLILMLSLFLHPLESQGFSEGEEGEGQLKPEIFVPFVSLSPAVTASKVENQLANDDHNRIHHHASEHLNRSRFAALGDEWPPQPKSMRNIVWNDISPVLDRMAELRANNDVALRNAQVQDALGERFAYIGTEEMARKGNMGRTDVRNTYFSHTYNQTIEVMVEQNQVTDIRTMDASEYQPPLAQEEIDEAIEIARAYFAEQGVARVAELQGFTILTYPGEGEGIFHNNRIGYVSFHPDSDTPPEFVAWVDLTEQVVVESREE